MKLEVIVRGKTIVVTDAEYNAIIAAGRPAEVARTLRDVFVGMVEAHGKADA